VSTLPFEEQQRIIVDYIPLAGRVATQWANKNSYFTRDEFRSATLTGLVRAGRGWDPEKGGGFGSYAARRMNAEVIDQMRMWGGRTTKGQQKISARSLDQMRETAEAGLGDLDFEPQEPSSVPSLVETRELLQSIMRLPTFERDCLLSSIRGESLEEVAKRHSKFPSYAVQTRARWRDVLAADYPDFTAA
jgi:RNA polymerase sigma factor (sigma-70 family)